MAPPNRNARLQIKLDEGTRLMLEILAPKLGLDMSAVVRMLIREKCVFLGIPDPSATAAKPKRRAAP